MFLQRSPATVCPAQRDDDAAGGVASPRGFATELMFALSSTATFFFLCLVSNDVELQRNVPSEHNKMPAHQPSTVIHIDKLTILSNTLYDAEAYAARHNHGSRSKVIVSDIKQAMRVLTGPLESDAEQQQQQPTSLQPPVSNESRLSNRFPSVIGSRAQQEVPPSPSPVPPPQPTPIIVPEALSGIF